MRDFVYGDDVIIEAYKDGDYHPFACAEEVSVRMHSELVETTVPDSGAWEDYVPSGRNSWDMSLSGVAVLTDPNDTLWYPWETLLYQLRMQGLQVKITFTDRNGFSKYAAGKVYIPDSEIDGKSGDFGRWNLQLKGTGPLDVNGILEPIINPTVERIQWIANGGEPNVVQDNRLIGILASSIQQVSWEGDDKFFVITAGVPTDKQVLFDNAHGTLTFKNDFEDGDYIWCQILNA